MMNLQLAVIIVNWNTKDLTRQAIRSLLDDVRNNGPAQTGVWVVDNASTDGSLEAIRREFPEVTIIQSQENVGFGAGNNLALRALGFSDDSVDEFELPEAVYLLNSDTITHSGATNSLYESLMRLPAAGVVGARLTYEDGSFQHSAFAFPGLMQLWLDLIPSWSRLYDTRLNGRYARHLYQGYEPFEVGHTLGATMMIKREVIQRTGMFDEDFFMYAEEVDWCWRIQKAGWKIYCVPTAHVTHLEGKSTSLVKPRSVKNLWESRLRLFEKHYPRWKLLLAKQLIKLGMLRKLNMTKSAYQSRQISAKERDALLDAYQEIRNL
jgi:N-acetylglucosaminyl-diphospho-decaprenol L-rhamnosyltransferase